MNSKCQVLYIHVLIFVPENSGGTVLLIVLKEPNPVVPDDLLKDVSKWTSEGVTENDVLTGYDVKLFKVDMLSLHGQRYIL